MDEEIRKSIIKRAKGYRYNEVQEEYSVDGDGVAVMTRRKVMKKYCPPDAAALKTYMDLCREEDDVCDKSDEELEEEKQRLLALLSGEQRQKNTPCVEERNCE